MITIIFGPPRIGKTAFLTNILNNACFDYERNSKMRDAIKESNKNGFNLSIPTHCVSANYDLKFIQQGYHERKARFINPFRLGFANDEVDTHFMLPFETIGIMEAQKYFNSRAFKNFRDWQSRFYEQHGHLGINIYLDTQRPGLIDVNIRELANFIEIIDMKVAYAPNGRFESITWTIRQIDNEGLLNLYLQSGKQDKSCYKQSKVTSYVNVFELYDSQNCAPKFYAGHFNSDYDLNYKKLNGNSKQDYIQYLKDLDDEMPDGLKPKNKRDKDVKEKGA